MITRKEIIDYCLTFPLSYEDYLFDGIADAGAWTVMRHKSNKKSFALIYERSGKLCVNLSVPRRSADARRAGGISLKAKCTEQAKNPLKI